MKLIQTITLTSAQANIEFTSIPQTFTDLVVLASARTALSQVSGVFSVNINDGLATQTWRRLQGDGSAVASTNGSADSRAGAINGSTSTANTFNNHSLYFPNYTGNSVKIYSADSVVENNATSSIQVLYALSRDTTAPITTLAFSANDNLVAGSTISLYGILKGSDGITTAS